MTREAGYSPSGVLGARGGAGSGVVEVRSALPPTAVHALSLVHLCAAQDGARWGWREGREGGVGWGWEGESGVGRLSLEIVETATAD